MSEQMTIAPSAFGACPHEIATAQMSERSTKSLCDVLGKEMWTNCREWGVCTLVGKPW